MTKHFQHEIEKLKKKILRLAAMVEDNLISAVRSVTQRDLPLSRKVASSDAAIDALEVEVEEDCLKILALYQPVAADLRYVVAVLKINSDLERIADLAVNIANRAVTLITHGDMPAVFDLPDMLDGTVDMVRKSVDSLVTQNTDVARQVCLDDDTIDAYHKSVFTVVQDQLQAHPERAEYLISLLSVSRNLERIADHATNIAEDVIYMIEGEIVRHPDLSS
jgi:phosphate transport system protein